MLTNQTSYEPLSQWISTHTKRHSALFHLRHPRVAPKFSDWHPALLTWLTCCKLKYEDAGWALCTRDEKVDFKTCEEDGVRHLGFRNHRSDAFLHLCMSCDPRILECASKRMREAVILINGRRGCGINWVRTHDNDCVELAMRFGKKDTFAELDTDTAVLADVPRLWCPVVVGDNTYAACDIGGHFFPLHLFILELDVWLLTQKRVVHLDGNTLNNRTDNLATEPYVAEDADAPHIVLSMTASTELFGEDRYSIAIVLPSRNGAKRHKICREFKVEGTYIEQLYAVSSLLDAAVASFPIAGLAGNVLGRIDGHYDSRSPTVGYRCQ